MAKSVILDNTNYLLSSEKYECCICNEKSDKYYIICKPGSVNRKECIEKIKEREKVPIYQFIF